MATVKGVPRRGATTPEWVETRIGELFLQLTRTHQGHEPTGKEVHAALKAALGGENLIADLPSLRKVQEVLQRTREGLRRLLQEHRLSDAPWSLGSLVTHYLPPDALIDVLEVWEWSLAIGVPLTIREAQWTARLRSTMPTDSEGRRDIEGWLGKLYGWVYIYARRERATEALGNPNDTSDLDVHLVEMSAWEWHTAHLVGVFTPPRLLWEDDRHERISDKEADLDRTSGHYFTMTGGLPHEHVERELGVSGWEQARYPIEGSASWSLEMIYPTPEESKVYAYWLRHLSKGPKWDGLPFERREEIAIRLCEEVQAVAAATQLYRDLVARGMIIHKGERDKFWGDYSQFHPAPGYSIGPEPGAVPIVTFPVDRLQEISMPDPSRQPRPPFFAWKPKDLLQEVGYQE